jgi:hypothetical protein
LQRRPGDGSRWPEMTESAAADGGDLRKTTARSGDVALHGPRWSVLKAQSKAAVRSSTETKRGEVRDHGDGEPRRRRRRVCAGGSERGDGGEGGSEPGGVVGHPLSSPVAPVDPRVEERPERRRSAMASVTGRREQVRLKEREEAGWAGAAGVKAQ